MPDCVLVSSADGGSENLTRLGDLLVVVCTSSGAFCEFDLSGTLILGLVLVLVHVAEFSILSVDDNCPESLFFAKEGAVVPVAFTETVEEHPSSLIPSSLTFRCLSWRICVYKLRFISRK